MASEDRLHTRQYLFLRELRNSAEEERRELL